jgi:hypothetical protein
VNHPYPWGKSPLSRPDLAREGRLHRTEFGPVGFAAVGPNRAYVNFRGPFRAYGQSGPNDAHGLPWPDARIVCCGDRVGYLEISVLWTPASTVLAKMNSKHGFEIMVISVSAGFVTLCSMKLFLYRTSRTSSLTDGVSFTISHRMLRLYTAPRTVAIRRRHTIPMRCSTIKSQSIFQMTLGTCFGTRYQMRAVRSNGSTKVSGVHLRRDVY